MGGKFCALALTCETFLVLKHPGASFGEPLVIGGEARVNIHIGCHGGKTVLFLAGNGTPPFLVLATLSFGCSLVVVIEYGLNYYKRHYFGQ